MFTASCISNGIGIAMMLMLIITNREHIRRNRLTKYLFRAVIITLLSCMAEIIGVIHVLYGMILLDRSKRWDEVVIRFSAGIFLAPVVAGVIAQSLLFGISVIWVSVAFTVFMTDFNDFKSINDDFGHGEGDQALIATSRIFSNAVVGRGRVIRCAGDEFVLIIRSVYEAVIQDVIEMIERGFEEYNSRNKLNYTLSASMGQAVFDSSRQTFRNFLGILDRKMYENKRKHYENDEYDRRKQLPLR